MENQAHRFAMDEQRPRFERIAQRHDNGTAPRAVTAYQLFQTPAALVARMVQLAEILPGMRTLEPSAGLGRLVYGLTAVAGIGPIVAVEIAPQLTRELYIQGHPGVEILQRDFLAMDPGHFPLFDRVVMNPPFHMRADIRHINHALTFLRPGGVLVALALDTPQREEALRPIAEEWHHVEAGTFAQEGTRVPCVLMKIRQP